MIDAVVMTKDQWQCQKYEEEPRIRELTLSLLASQFSIRIRHPRSSFRSLHRYTRNRWMDDSRDEKDPSWVERFKDRWSGCGGGD